MAKNMKRIPILAAFAAVILVGSVVVVTFATSGADVTPPVFVKATCTATTSSCSRAHISTIESFLGSVYPAPPTPTPTDTGTPTDTTTAPSSTVPSSTSPTPTPTGAPCVITASSGNCGPYSYPANTWSNGYNTYVGQNMWNPIPGASQTLTAYDPGNFTVEANIPAGHGGSVVSYPNSEQKPPCCAEPALSSFASIKASFAESMPHNSATSAWAAWDNWFNNWANEVMIQVDFTNNGPCTYQAVTQFGGSNGVPQQTWGLCVYGSELIWKLAPTGAAVGSSATVNESSGSVDILAMTQWLVDHGYMKQGSTVTDTSFGWEICSTGGAAETFAVTSYSITAS